MSIMHGELQGKEAKQNYARQPIWLLNELSGLHSCGPLKLSSSRSGLLTAKIVMIESPLPRETVIWC
jgi:hypothetical protein